MRYRLTILAVLALVDGAAGRTILAQGEPRQRVRLVGRVFDQTRRLVKGVEVTVNRREVRAVTDDAGIFQLDVLPGDSVIAFRRIGYRPMLLAMDPLPAVQDTVPVELQAIPVQLSEVIVLTHPSKPLRYAGTTKYDEVFLRQQVGLGTFISRQAIEQRFGLRAYELLRGIPGVRIWNGPPKRIRFTRCQEPGGVSVFVDGVREVAASLSPSAASGPAPAFSEEPELEILSRINPADIEMIEVFRGASEIPAVFHWNGCAVIAIWTRWNK